VRVGVPKEVKDNEHRVALTPAGVRELVFSNHEVLLEHDAGRGSSITDAEFQRAGARIVADAETVWGDSDMVLKVKEPVPEEFSYLRAGLILFTYLHLAASESLTKALMDSGTTAMAYETVELPDRSLPLLAPMSEVAGRMAPQVGATFLERERGGRGVLMGGVSGVAPARVVILDRNINKLRDVDRIHKGRILTLASNRLSVEQTVVEADLVIGAVLVPGALAPTVVNREIIEEMRPRSVVVDISIDQGGCFETSHMTTHSDPTYVVSDVVHYCVGNMPGAVPHTSTYALTNATLEYVVALADGGVEGAVAENDALAKGVNVYKGALVIEPVAEAHGLAALSLADLV
jgi:alanine dehydrogenase